jgi:hypothetical protein
MSRSDSTGSSWATAILVAGVVLAVAGAAAFPVLRSARADLVRETATLQAATARSGTVLDSMRREQAALTATLALERARAVARQEPKLHLVIAVDSGTVALVRDGITLRTMPARFQGGPPSRGTQTITRIAESVIAATAPTVDSLGNTIMAAAPETKVERVTLSDGTVIEGGDAARALLGGVEVASGPRMIIVSRRDFAAVRPNLVRGMKAVSF